MDWPNMAAVWRRAMTHRSGYALALASLALAFFLFAHARGLSIAAFADDFAIVRLSALRVTSGELWADVAQRFTGSLVPGNLMWRPIPYASFGLDALLHGDLVPRWRWTNLVAYVGSAMALAGLVRAIGLNSFAAAAAAGTFLLQPWAPEVSLWIVGRYDGFATLSVIASLACAATSRGFDRWLLLSACAAACAYASKESASTLPALLALVLFSRDRYALAKRRFVPSKYTAQAGFVHLALFVAYLAARRFLLATPSLDLYGTTAAVTTFLAWARSFAGHLLIAREFADLSPRAAHVAIAVFLFVWLIALTNRGTRTLAIIGALLAAVVAAALAFVFPHASGSTDGARVYQLMSLGLALIVAAFAAHRITPLRVVTVLVLLASLAIWQRAAVEEWRVASNAMLNLQREIRLLGERIPAKDYALIVAPDAIGRVPFARNANGGLLLEYGGDRERVSQMIVSTDLGVHDWFKLSADGVIRKYITTRPDAPEAPTHFYCFDGQHLRFVGYWRSDSLADWEARWRDAFNTHCSNLRYAR